jgi:hypothetical protein
MEEGCLSEEEIILYLEKHMEAEEKSKVNLHLLICPLCLINFYQIQLKRFLSLDIDPNFFQTHLPIFVNQQLN